MEQRKQFIEQLCGQQENLRSISVIAHIDHGKTTLTDCLVRKAGLSNKERFIDSVRDDQIERIITIKATGLTLNFPVGPQITPREEKAELLLSLVDSPGHLDFNDQVTSALRLTDGALVVVDCISGVACQTETVLRQAIEERVTPVLFLNKLDRAFLELKKNEEELYKDLFATVERTNVLIRTFAKEGEEFNIPILDPVQGNVAFGSGKMGWAFTLLQFAKLYASDNTPIEKMAKYLWGDWFYDAKNKKWRNTQMYEGEKLERGFVKFILRPVYQLCKLTSEESQLNWNKLESMAKKLLPDMTQREQKELNSCKSLGAGKELTQKVFSLVLPAAEPILSMIHTHIPSPLVAQKYRATSLYTGPIEDEFATAISKCDASGPLCVYVTKMVSFNKTFLAYARILSGTLTDGMKVNVLGPKYNPSRQPPIDFFKNVSVKGVKFSLAKDFIGVDKAVAGNIVCIGGLEKCVDKSCTLYDCVSTKEKEVLYPIKAMSFSVSPVVRVSVAPENVSDLPKLKDGLSILAKSSSMVEIAFDESTKQFVVSGAGELHIEILMKDLQEFSNCKLKISQPVVPFCETITFKSLECLAKSPNKLNRIFCTAEPLSLELLKEIQEGKIAEISSSQGPKGIAKYLVEKHDWDPNDAKKIWCFGPETSSKPSNVLVDQTRASDYLNEIKDHLISAFQQVCSEGALAGEPLIGVRFNITEVKVHSDSSHRGASQIVNAAARLFKGCQLSSGPRLVEPVYLASIRLATETLGAVHQFLSGKRTEFVSENHFTNQVELNVFLPVLSSFGFDAKLKECSSGRAFPSLNFSHFQTIDSDPVKEGSQSNVLAVQIRERKGLKKEFPLPSDLLDKL